MADMRIFTFPSVLCGRSPERKKLSDFFFKRLEQELSTVVKSGGIAASETNSQAGTNYLSCCAYRHDADPALAETEEDKLKFWICYLRYVLRRNIKPYG